MKIIRVSNIDKCTMGVLIDNEGLPFCLTLENPWLDNQRSISCIPTGKYKCKIVDSPKYGKVYEVLDVPERTHILFHSGNVEKDTRGCILLGSNFGTLSAQPAVLSSRITVDKFMKYMDGSDFDLEIS